MRESRWTVFFLTLLVAILVPAVVFLAMQVYALPSGVRFGGPAILLPAAPRAAPAFTPATAAPTVRQFAIAMAMLGEGEQEQHKWLPGTIIVNQGDTVILRVANADTDASHGFAIAGYDVFEKTIRSGEMKTFQFQATAPGIFLFSCALPGCAADHGEQTGQMVVLGAP